MSTLSPTHLTLMCILSPAHLTPQARILGATDLPLMVQTRGGGSCTVTLAKVLLSPVRVCSRLSQDLRVETSSKHHKCEHVMPSLDT